MPEPKYIIVIGTSAGGLNALSELVTQFRKDADAAIFIVMHLSRTSISDFLMYKLRQFTDIPCSTVVDGADIESGHIYISPANVHLVIVRGKMILGKGPVESRWKPSIDILFRSAAAAYNTKVIGIILTGLLDDGTSGMSAIKRSGGTTIVQDPNEAEFADMPLSVLNAMEVDHCVVLSEIGMIINNMLEHEPEEGAAPPDVIIESEIAERVLVSVDSVSELGEKSVFACPDCGGGLWSVKESTHPERFRCHIGHAYSQRELSSRQVEVLESTLWVAVRMMEERRALLQKMEDTNQKKGLKNSALGYQHKRLEIETHMDKLKEILYSTEKNIEV